MHELRDEPEPQLSELLPRLSRVDLVIVEGDPTRNISDIRRTALVVKNGNLYDPKALHAAIGVQAAN